MTNSKQRQVSFQGEPFAHSPKPPMTVVLSAPGSSCSQGFPGPAISHGCAETAPPGGSRPGHLASTPAGSQELARETAHQEAAAPPCGLMHSLLADSGSCPALEYLGAQC